MPHCCAWNIVIALTYHFIAYPKMKRLWTKNINRTELPSHVYLCSLHFEENCFDSHHDMKQKLMSPNAKPSWKLLKGAVLTVFAQRCNTNARLSSTQRLQKKNQREVNLLFCKYISLTLLTGLLLSLTRFGEFNRGGDLGARRYHELIEIIFSISFTFMILW